MVVNGTSNVVNYGICSTAMSKAEKVVSCSNFALITGAEITVKFTAEPAPTKSNTIAKTRPPTTLNVNNTGAKNIQYRGRNIYPEQLAENKTYTFRYNGSEYDLVGDLDTNDIYLPAGDSFGLVKSGGDVTISDGIITVNDDTHNHIIRNIDGLQTALDGKAASSHTHNYAGSASAGGPANSANKLTTARKISLSGGVTGTATNFDGSSDITIPVTAVDPSKISDGYTTKGFYINTHPENQPTIIPFINNDIAFLLKRGGSAVVKYDDVEQNVDISNVFDGSPSYWSMNPNNITTITIELTLHKQFGYGNIIYVDCGSNTFRSKNLKIEVINTNYADDVWQTVGTLTDRLLSQYKVLFSHTPVGASDTRDGFNKIRLTFSNWSNPRLFRIAGIGVIGFNSYGLREPFLPRDGGELYGSLSPYFNNTNSLGTPNKKWNAVYATTFNGSLSGNASTATKLATARTIALTGSVTGSGTFDGSGNLSIATTTSHNHDSNYVKKSGDTMTGNLTVPTVIGNLNGNASSATSLKGTPSSSAVPLTDPGAGTIKYYYNVNNDLTGNMPAVHNGNGILYLNTHSGEYGYQLGFSSDGNIYYRNKNSSAFTSSVPWNKILSSDNYTSYTVKKDGTGASGTWGINVSGNANSASKVNNKLTVGSKTFDGSAAVTIAASDLGLASAMLFLGTTTTAISDGATTNPVTIGGASKTVTAGNVVLYGNKEFAWTGSAWEELGNEGSYKIVQAAVADPSASGTSNTFIATISQDANGKITATKKTVAVTNNAPTLSWGTTSTIGSVAGTNLQVKMPANPNTDTKVTQTVTTSNAAYPLLLAPNGQTATTTTTSYFDSGVTLNPSTNTIAANISGNAATATKATQDGSGNTITSKYITVDTSQTISGSKTFTSATNMNNGLMINTSLKDHSDPMKQCLVINSGGLTDTVTNVTDKNSPGIGFHIGNVSWGSLIFGRAGFKFINSDATDYMNVTAGKFIGDLQGNADTATKLATARTIALTGSVTGSGTFDGSGNLSITTTTNHTHNYAGSSSAGGSANSAVKLDTTTAGSTTQPVYFTDGKPKAISYTIAKSVPSNAVFTDINARQTLTSNNINYPLLMAQQANTITTNNIDNITYRNNSIYANPSTGMVAATSYKISEHVNLQYDSTNECLNFVFA